MTTVSNTSQRWSPLTSTDHQVINELLVSYWGRREIVLIASAESPYRLHSVIAAAAKQFADEDQACMQAGFPRRVVEMFRDHHLSLWRVPDLNTKLDDLLKDQNKGKGWIMRCRNDEGNPGLVFRVPVYCPGSNYGRAFDIYGEPLPYVSAIWIFNSRKTGKENIWEVRGTFFEDSNHHGLPEGHRMALTGYCTYDRNTRLNFLKFCLSGTDTYFRMGEILQEKRRLPAFLKDDDIELNPLYQGIDVGGNPPDLQDDDAEQNPIQQDMNARGYPIWMLCVSCVDRALQYLHVAFSAVYDFFAHLFHMQK